MVNTQTGFPYSAITNGEGIYRVPYVNPGIYEITYEAQSFKKSSRTKVQVRSTETARVDATLKLGSVVESLEVRGQPPLLETETSTAGHLVPGEQLNRLPTPQMNVQTTLWYVAGVTSQRGFGHVKSVIELAHDGQRYLFEGQPHVGGALAQP